MGKIRVKVPSYYKPSIHKRVKKFSYLKRDVGRPGRGKKLIKIKRKGALTSLGYSVHGTDASRHNALRKAVYKYGKKSVMGMLISQMVFRKTTDHLADKFEADKNWVKNNF
jgi:hypothetical protein